MSRQIVKPELSESQVRVLTRIADLMRESFSGRVELVLAQGGVRTFSESRHWDPKDLRSPEERHY